MRPLSAADPQAVSAVSEMQVASSVKLLPLGDSAWTIEFGERIDPDLYARVQGFAQAVSEARAHQGGKNIRQSEEGSSTAIFEAIVDVVPTFRSLTVHYNPLLVDGQRLGEMLQGLAASSGAVRSVGRTWRIPVCFDADLAPDLAGLAAAKNMTCEQVVALMTEATFQVYMIGFMPGFPYMGGLPTVLEMPRLPSPRKAVPARSLAFAGARCAVYPWESPGGWRLLGRTPVPFFSASESAPALLAAGDCVRWQAIERAEYTRLETAVSAGRLDRRRFLFNEERL